MTNPSDSAVLHDLRDPDARLMLSVRDGDDAAFEELVARYQSRVIGVLYHMLGNLDDAEDLAQEVFMRIYRNRNGYKPTAKFATWIFTIVNNLALNAIRDRKRKPSRPTGQTSTGSSVIRPLEQLAATPSGAMPSRIFQKGEMAEIVRTAVSQLSEDQRMAIMLNKFEDMNYRQIGDVMQKSEMAIKSLLSRARSQLREILQPYIANGDNPGAGGR